jgi:hypothetical protein
MNVFKMLSAEIIGLIFLIISAAATLTVPDVADFWIALATAITLFLLMYLHLHFNETPSERPETSQ